MTYSAEVLADSPLLYWRLGEASGTTAADTSGNSHAGTYVGGPTLGAASLLVTDSANTAMALVGNSGACCSIASASWMNVNSITVECLVNLTSATDTSNGDAIVSRYDGTGFNWLIWRNTSGNLAVQIRNNSGTAYNLTGPAVTLSTTYHVAFTFDGTNVILFVNGSSVASTAVTGTVQTGSAPIDAGRYSGSSGTTPGGTIDEVAVYGTALTSTRIAAHYTAATSSVTTVTAAVAMSAQASLGDAGVDTTSQAAALSAQASLSDVASVTEPGTVALSAQASLGDIGVVGTVVGMSAQASLSDVASVTEPGTVALSAQASLTAAPAVTEPGTAAFSARASLAVAGTVTTDAVTLALPLVEFTFDAPAVGLSAGVVLGLPVAEFTFDTPAVYLGNRKPLDRIVGHLYQGNGLTHISMLRIRNGKWREVVSQAGSASFDVPLEDASTEHITARRVVKLTWYRNGRAVMTFSCEIRSEGIELAVDGTRWLRFEDQPGCLIKLSDGIVRPEYGLRKYSPEDRLFGPMSASGPWLLGGNWRKPRGYPMSEDKGHYRFGFPPQLVKSNPDWVAAAWPRLGQPTGKKNYFRWPLTIASGGAYVQIVPTADNFLTMWHNGEQIISPNPDNPLGWMSADPLPLHLDAGVHEFGAMVENAPFPRANGYSPMGLIFTIFELNTAGKVIGILLKSNEVDLLAHDDQPEPGWFRAQVLYQLIAEAKAFGYVGPTQLRVGFTPYHDSAGRSWSTTSRGTYSFAIGDDLASVTDTLTEAHFDVLLDHVTMTVKAWTRAGRDRTSTVHILPGDQGGNLKSGASASTHARFTEVLTHRADGSWADVVDTAGRDAIGLVGTSLDLGTAGSESTASEVGKSQLRDSAKTQRSFTSQPSTVSGVIPYIHYFPGDYVSIPNERNTGLTSGRALAFTVDGSGDVVEAYSEIVEDLVPA